MRVFRESNHAKAAKKRQKYTAAVITYHCSREHLQEIYPSQFEQETVDNKHLLESRLIFKLHIKIRTKNLLDN